MRRSIERGTTDLTFYNKTLVTGESPHCSNCKKADYKVKYDEDLELWLCKECRFLVKQQFKDEKIVKQFLQQRILKGTFAKRK